VCDVFDDELIFNNSINSRFLKVIDGLEIGFTLSKSLLAPLFLRTQADSPRRKRGGNNPLSPPLIRGNSSLA
jgi:hypothetical protein